MTASSQLVAILTWCAASAAAQERPQIVLLDTAVMVAPRLSESSGVTASLRRRGVYWTINDSGNEPILFATDSAGRDLGYVRVTAAQNVDWEDLALAPCVVTSRACLYVADIGDNAGARPYVVVYRIPEPDPPEGPGDTLRSVGPLDSIVLRYPDRPHNAEALVVAHGRTLMIVTKDRTGPPGVFQTRLPTRNGAALLEFAGTLPINVNLVRGRLVTGAALSPSGDVLAVRTYVSMHFFRRGAGAFDVPLTPPDGILIPVVESQGEGVAFDGPDLLVLTSERGTAGRALLTRLRVLGLGQ
ncbi:MAG: hypothetical protein Q7J79_05980 [Gemmatimonadales bacterium]|nr:hypothetical protein [Gemmatimonadales bacterium]